MSGPVPHPSERKPTAAERTLALKQYRWCREVLAELPLPALMRARSILAGAVVSALQDGSVARAYSVVRAIEHLDSLRPVAQRWHDEDQAAVQLATESRELAARQEVLSEERRRGQRVRTSAFCSTCSRWVIWWCPTRLQYECDHCGGSDVVPQWIAGEEPAHR